ncbi:MAG: hypothetical protein EOP84_00275 [Verrucomicrobiaceae bacterium]|nr:MAG: hypothetical protein EOP84_00275 [Verrucomicrobiaceae bacterium]
MQRLRRAGASLASGHRLGHAPDLVPAMCQVRELCTDARSGVVTAFCEWTETSPKQKKWFRLKDNTPFMFAGIWRPWNGTRGTKAKPSLGDHLLYAFLTTVPNEIVKAIHPKAQPAILTRKDWMTWLQAPWPVAKELVHPSPVDEMLPPSEQP